MDRELTLLSLSLHAGSSRRSLFQAVTRSTLHCTLSPLALAVTLPTSEQHVTLNDDEGEP